jgi:hypothetical protein
MLPGTHFFLYPPPLFFLSLSLCHISRSMRAPLALEPHSRPEHTYTLRDGRARRRVYIYGGIPTRERQREWVLASSVFFVLGVWGGGGECGYACGGVSQHARDKGARSSSVAVTAIPSACATISTPTSATSNPMVHVNVLFLLRTLQLYLSGGGSLCLSSWNREKH